MTATGTLFLNEKRLISGPWQALERDVARLMLVNSFVDVRIVGGTGDHGGDILAIKDGKTWVVQCKYTSSTPPPKDALEEIVEAGRFYKADRLLIATSRPPGEAFLKEKSKYEHSGLKIYILDPATLLNYCATAPEYSSSRRKLREYQDEIVDKFRQTLLDTGRGQVVLATGLGKTVIMAELVADLLRDNLIQHGRVLVLAHTKELVRQLHRSFWLQLPKWVPTHQLADGEIPTFWDGVTFATIQSVLARMESLPEFGLVLVDEAHHIGADMFQKGLDLLQPKMLGGATATPWRGDGYDIDTMLGPAIVKMGIADGLRQGFLAEVDYRLLADNLDWEVVQNASHNKYSLAQLNRKLIIPTRDEKAARIITETFKSERRKTGIVFSPTIYHAQSFAAMLRQYGIRAEAISSDTPAREQDKLMARFRAGHLDIVATVDLFNEGVDVPDVDLVIFMRSTHSRRIFVQQLGRGLRTNPGKTKTVVLDFVTDLRRMAEVIELDRAVRGGSIEHLGLGGQLVQFSQMNAGDFMREWMLDQASLILREDEANLDLPQFEFPIPPAPGGVE